MVLRLLGMSVSGLVYLTGTLGHFVDGHFVSGPSHHPLGGPRFVAWRMVVCFHALRPADGHFLSGPSHAGCERTCTLSVNW